MWELAFTIFLGSKWLTWQRTPVPKVSWWRHAGYLFAWPGLDAQAFLRTKPIPLQDRPTRKEWQSAGTKLLAGLAIFWGAGRFIPVARELLLGWAGMVGLVLILLVISVPAGGGYGWPTLFFAIQGCAILAERSRFGRARGLGRARLGRLWLLMAVLSPACGLFHPPFVRCIVVPFMRACGAA
jgi:hypothetical protein